MPYSDHELEEIGRDPIRLRAWWWHMAMRHQRFAREKRELSRMIGRDHPVTNYRERFDEGYDLIRWAIVSDRVASVILDDIELFIRTTLEPAKCTCSPRSTGPESKPMTPHRGSPNSPLRRRAMQPKEHRS